MDENELEDLIAKKSLRHRHLTATINGLKIRQHLSYDPAQQGTLMGLVKAQIKLAREVEELMVERDKRQTIRDAEFLKQAKGSTRFDPDWFDRTYPIKKKDGQD